MAKVVFTEKLTGKTASIKTSDYPIVDFDNEDIYTKITDRTFDSDKIESKSYPIAEFDTDKYSVRLDEVLPFRVKFINIGIEGYGQFNVPPIGIAIIGVNNYIL